MIMLAQNLGKLVVAEGVQTQEQKQWLQSLGCDQMQGFFFAAPQSLESTIEWLQAAAEEQYQVLN